MIKPSKRWLNLPGIEALLDGDPGNRDAIVEGCRAGEIKSRIKVHYGSGHKDFEPLKWEMAKVDWKNSTVTFSTMVIGDRIFHSTFPVELDRDAVMVYFGLREPRPQREEPGESKNRGGRPRKYDWEAFLIELAAHVFANGLPDKQADLEQYMMQWCMNTWAEEPSLSEVRKRVSKLLHAIERG